MRIRGAWRVQSIVRQMIMHANRRSDYRALSRKIHQLTFAVIEKARQKSLRYAERLRIASAPYGQYRYKEGNEPPLLYSSIYAALLRHLLGDLGNLTAEHRNQWIAYINGFQCEDGLFRDPQVSNDIAEKEDWWGWRHLTMHALMALRCLGGHPETSMRFLEMLDSPDKVSRWLAELDWGCRVAFTSNTVQNYCAAMQYQGITWGKLV